MENEFTLVLECLNVKIDSLIISLPHDQSTAFISELRRKKEILKSKYQHHEQLLLMLEKFLPESS